MRLRAVAFGGEYGPRPAVGDADKTLQRGAVKSAGATQEIAAQDILEDHPIAGPIARPVASSFVGSSVHDIEYDIPIDVAPLEPPRVEAKSISAVAIEVDPGLSPFASPFASRGRAESTFQIDALQPARRQLGPVVMTAMAVSLIILLGAAIRTRVDQNGDTASANASSVLAPRTQAAAPVPVATPSPVTLSGAISAPVSAVSSVSLGGGAPTIAGAAPRSTSATDDATDSTTGTVTAAPGVRPLYIDGARITASSAIVTCGRHLVRAGWAKPRAVIVPCGKTLYVDRGGKTTAR
jgi:hypothetical protein